MRACAGAGGALVLTNLFSALLRPTLQGARRGRQDPRPGCGLLTAAGLTIMWHPATHDPRHRHGVEPIWGDPEVPPGGEAVEDNPPWEAWTPSGRGPAAG